MSVKLQKYYDAHSKFFFCCFFTTVFFTWLHLTLIFLQFNWNMVVFTDFVFDCVMLRDLFSQLHPKFSGQELIKNEIKWCNCMALFWNVSSSPCTNINLFAFLQQLHYIDVNHNKHQLMQQSNTPIKIAHISVLMQVLRRLHKWNTHWATTGHI